MNQLSERWKMTQTEQCDRKVETGVMTWKRDKYKKEADNSIKNCKLQNYDSEFLLTRPLWGLTLLAVQCNENCFSFTRTCKRLESSTNSSFLPQAKNKLFLHNIELIDLIFQ